MAPRHTIHEKTRQARQRRRLIAQERLARDRRQATHAVTVLEQALHALGLPANLVAEIEGRLRSQKKLLGKIVGVMFPPLLAAAPTPNCVVCGAGIRIWCAVKAASRNVNRPQAYRCLVSL